MGKSGSSSSSTTENTTANYDQRVAADGSGLALGSGAAIITENAFSDNVAKAYQALVDFASGALTTVKETQQQAVSLGERAVNSAVESSQNAIQATGESSSKALDTVLEIGQGAADLIKTALDAVKTQSEAALTKVAENQQAQNPASSSSYTEIIRWIVIGAVVIAALFIFLKGK